MITWYCPFIESESSIIRKFLFSYWLGFLLVLNSVFTTVFLRTLRVFESIPFKSIDCFSFIQIVVFLQEMATKLMNQKYCPEGPTLLFVMNHLCWKYILLYNPTPSIHFLMLMWMLKYKWMENWYCFILSRISWFSKILVMIRFKLYWENKFSK